MSHTLFIHILQIPNRTSLPISKSISNKTGLSREREGTQIFKAGEKPDVIHYVSSPDTAQDNLVEKLDVRTPSDVSIPALQL